MDLSWFLIMLASPILIIVTVFGMFVWAAKAKPPSFLQETEENTKNK